MAAIPDVAKVIPYPTYVWHFHDNVTKADYPFDRQICYDLTFKYITGENFHFFVYDNMDCFIIFEDKNGLRVMQFHYVNNPKHMLGKNIIIIKYMSNGKDDVDSNHVMIHLHKLRLKYKILQSIQNEMSTNPTPFFLWYFKDVVSMIGLPIPICSYITQSYLGNDWISIFEYNGSKCSIIFRDTDDVTVPERFGFVNASFKKSDAMVDYHPARLRTLFDIIGDNFESDAKRALQYIRYLYNVVNFEMQSLSR